MVFRTESGEAIIPETRKKIQEDQEKQTPSTSTGGYVPRESKPVPIQVQRQIQREEQEQKAQIPASKQQLQQPDTYSKIKSAIHREKVNVAVSRLPMKEKQQRFQELQQQEKKVRYYQQRGFEAQEVMLPGTLEKGQMGPPAPVKGYTFVPTDKIQLDWMQYQLKQTEKLPPVARESSQFGMGVVSSLFSVASPVAHFVGQGKTFETMTTIAFASQAFPVMKQVEQLKGGLEAGKYGIHYPSTLDIVLEPVGLAPKGTTELLKKYPAFTAGGVGGEAVQFYAGGQVLKGIGKGVGVTARYTIPKTVPKVSRILKRVSPSFAKKLSQTTIGKNVGLYAKGYVPVVRGTETVVAAESSKLVKGTTRASRIIREFKLKPKKWYGFVEREFIPKSSVKQLKTIKEVTGIFRPKFKEAPVFVETGAKEQVQTVKGVGQATKTVLSEQKVIRIPVKTGEEFTFLSEQSGYKKGIISGLKRKYSSFKYSMETGKSYIENVIKPKTGSFYNVQNVKKIPPILESEVARWDPKVRWLYDVVLPHQQGTSKITPIIGRVTTERGTSATGSLLLRNPMETIIKSAEGRIIRSGSSTLLPAYKSGLSSALTFGTPAVMSAGIRSELEWRYPVQQVKPKTILQQTKKEISIPTTEKKQGGLVITTGRVQSIIDYWKPLPITKKRYIVKPVVIQQQETMKSVRMIVPPIQSRPISSMIPPFFFSSSEYGPSGVSKKGIGFDIVGYRYRRWKVPKLSDLLGGM